MSQHLISEISTSPLFMRENAHQSVMFTLHRLIEGGKLDPVRLPHVDGMVKTISAGSSDTGNPFYNYPENSIAVIPIVGSMYKYGGWSWDGYIFGMDDIANLLRQADASENIIGTILYINTPGGTTQSVIQLEDALRSRTKPSVAFVDGMCCSAGIYVASFCDTIVAANRMCDIGSIGTQVVLYDYDGMFEKWGVKKVVVRPDESKYKNTEYEDALKGDDSRLKNESLKPFAEHFQQIIKSNRPNLNQSIEGILEGKVFYAYAAEQYGLIDTITNFEGAVGLLRKIDETNQSIYSQFK